MPLNNQIIYSFIEAYLKYRAMEWGLDQISPTADRLGGSQKRKMLICSKAIQDCSFARSTDDWLNILYDLYNKEIAETKIDYSYSHALFHWGENKSRKLCLLISAIRSYIVSELKSNPEFHQREKELRTNLEKIKSINTNSLRHMSVEGPIDIALRKSNQSTLELINSRFKAISEFKMTHTQFFDEFIVKNMSDSSVQTFNDLVTSINNNEMTNPMCTYIIANIFQTEDSAPNQGQYKT